MARSLHESINPVELFIPLVNDVFFVDANAAPNLDTTLRMVPSTNDIRAFAKAPTMAKNLFKQRTYDWSFSCWIKVHSNANQSGPLFVIQNNNAGGGMDANMPLYISWGGLNGTSMNIQYYGAAGSENFGRSHNTIGVWTLFVFLIPQPGIAAKSFMGRADVGTPDSAFTNHANVFSGSDVYNSNLRCAIGKYGDNAPNNSMFANVSIMKLAFHDHLLTLAECQALYAAMMTGTAAPPGSLGPAAVISGGTVTTPGDGCEYHTFTSNGTLTVTSGGEIGRLMIGGGGGGGGSTAGGGGGAGECIVGQTLIGPGTYPIVIGPGGNGGAATPTAGSNGGDTTFNGQTARGGGGGGLGSGGGGLTGGQGGGGGYTSGGGSGYQFNGGNAASGQKGGGGGGAAGPGGNGSTSISGFGGPAKVYGGVAYGGGGSGGARTDDPNPNIGAVAGGAGLGGSGTNGNNATAGTGSGGGGGGYNGSAHKAGGNGASGAVVIRVLL